MNVLYRVPLSPEVVDDGPVLVLMLSWQVARLTEMAVEDGHRVSDLHWQGVMEDRRMWADYPPAPAWVCVRVRP